MRGHRKTYVCGPTSPAPYRSANSGVVVACLAVMTLDGQTGVYVLKILDTISNISKSIKS